MRGAHLVSSLWLALSMCTAAAAAPAPDRCVPAAARYHHVNENILRAILSVESRMQEHVVTRNSNGSVDVGIAGINSVHFASLARVGIAPENLLDACVSTYVAAWELSKRMATYGNTWYGVAAYHSATPYYNQRYQILLYNELVKKGVIVGQLQRVPSLTQ